MNTDIITHYDLLIDEGNDPLYDSEPLRTYMDKWDGKQFIDALQLNKNKSVLEIGIGTGRLAEKVIPLCGKFTGIDISPKTIDRAKQHLGIFENITLICDDYITYNFTSQYDVIYSSLTWMHFQCKKTVINKTARLLNVNGRFVLSISKDQADMIDFGTRKIQIYPDNPDSIIEGIKNSGMNLVEIFETENAFIFISKDGR